jgi:hypothetical protein
MRGLEYSHGLPALRATAVEPFPWGVGNQIADSAFDDCQIQASRRALISAFPERSLQLGRVRPTGRVRQLPAGVKLTGMRGVSGTRLMQEPARWIISLASTLRLPGRLIWAKLAGPDAALADFGSCLARPWLRLPLRAARLHLCSEVSPGSCAASGPAVRTLSRR